MIGFICVNNLVIHLICCGILKQFYMCKYVKNIKQMKDLNFMLWWLAVYSMYFYLCVYIVMWIVLNAPIIFQIETNLIDSCYWLLRIAADCYATVWDIDNCHAQLMHIQHINKFGMHIHRYDQKRRLKDLSCMLIKIRTNTPQKKPLIGHSAQRILLKIWSSFK